MNPQVRNKRKNINDPVYGFITLTDDMMFDIIEHPYFQRLRRIKQLGLTDHVYPSATHTRFQHALGAMHLMKQALQVLQTKGIRITAEEEAGVLRAILLHDIGHGPFSHSLEHSIIPDMAHEELSLLFMEEFNKQFPGAFDTAILVFKNEYPKKFLHQLVSSQLDMDRLDYLSRDSFFTGVAEGVINTDRIINMLNVAEDELVVEVKGIYSIEKFIMARRLMYWQVYLHKTVMAADRMLEGILRRAKSLAESGRTLFTTPALRSFLYKEKGFSTDVCGPFCLADFARLDDSDIYTAIKAWSDHEDPILAILCSSLTNRQLFRMEMQTKPFDPAYIEAITMAAMNRFGLNREDVGYFVVNEHVTNNAYDPKHDRIRVLLKNNKLADISGSSEELDISVLSGPVKKYILCYPKVVII